MVLLSNLHNCKKLQPSGKLNDVFWTCNEHCLKLHQPEACAALGPEPFTLEGDAENSAMSLPYQTLAVHYGLPHIDMHLLMMVSTCVPCMNMPMF